MNSKIAGRIGLGVLSLGWAYLIFKNPPASGLDPIARMILCGFPFAMHEAKSRDMSVGEAVFFSGVYGFAASIGALLLFGAFGFSVYLFD